MKNIELAGADVARLVQERDMLDAMDPLDLKVPKEHRKSQPPLIRKKRARRSDSLDRIETTMMKKNLDNIRSSQITEQRTETSASLQTNQLDWDTRSNPFQSDSALHKDEQDSADAASYNPRSRI